MFLGKVIGSVVCTQKDASLCGIKLLVVQPMRDSYKANGKAIVAIDTIGTSGQGDLVYLAKSKESSMPLPREMVASDAGIMGIVEDYYIMNREELL